MKWIFLVVLALSTLISCKQQPAQQEDSAGTQYSSWNQPIQGVGKITGAERDLGQEICEALREKRYFFSRQVDRSMNFTFDSEKKECNERTQSKYVSTAALRVARNGELSFESTSRSRVIEDVLVDTTSAIKEACLKLMNGEEIENTWGDSRTRTQLSFTFSSNRPQMQIVHFEYRNNGLFPYMIDRAVINRDVDTNQTSLIGIVRERSINQRCLNGETYYLSQKMR